MRIPRSRVRFLLWLLLIGILIALAWPHQQPLSKLDRAATSQVRGRVFDAVSPLADARVRFKGRAESVRTNAHGEFALVDPGARPPRLTAWKDGYFIQGASASDRPLRIELRPLPSHDDASYHWIDPTPDVADDERCGNCHEQIYDEWQASGHAHSARNKRFMNLFGFCDEVRHGPADVEV